MPSRLSNSELTYLNGILIASAIVVIAEGEINYRLRMGDDLLNGGEVIVVGIDRPCNRTKETGRLQEGLGIDGHACSPEKG
jgi:hypothetical protein